MVRTRGKKYEKNTRVNMDEFFSFFAENEKTFLAVSGFFFLEDVCSSSSSSCIFFSSCVWRRFLSRS